MLGERIQSNGSARPFDRRLAILSAAAASCYGSGALGLALLPLLAREVPHLLILLNPTTGVLLLVSARVGLVPFILLAVLRRLAFHIVFFLLGEWYGADAVAWVERRSGGRAARLVALVEGIFARVRWPVLLLAPGPLPSVLAGAGRMPRGQFLAFDLAGTLLGVLVARFAADIAADPLGAALRFSDQHAGLLTALCVAATMSWLLARWWRGRHGGAQPEHG
jgi:membrane protein DedA with SNARE-associated domain